MRGQAGEVVWVRVRGAQGVGGGRGHGGDFCAGGGFDELGVAVPFPAARVAAPAVEAAAAVAPLRYTVSSMCGERGTGGGGRTLLS